MNDLARLLDNNRAWAAAQTADDPEFFRRLVGQQSPRFHWIGCSDSRVPANQIVGLLPGEVFVHRNVANQMVPGDENGMAALQYAVEVLHVEHVIVCGHYRCGGIIAAVRHDPLSGPVDRWISHLRELCDEHAAELGALASEAARWDRLCDINVRTTVDRVAATPIVQRAWSRGQALAIHGVVYDVQDGLLRDLGVTRPTNEERP